MLLYAYDSTDVNDAMPSGCSSIVDISGGGTSDVVSSSSSSSSLPSTSAITTTTIPIPMEIDNNIIMDTNGKEISFKLVPINGTIKKEITKEEPTIAINDNFHHHETIDSCISPIVDIMEDDSDADTKSSIILSSSSSKSKQPKSSSLINNNTNSNRQLTPYYALKKKLLCTSGKVTRTVLSRSSKTTQNAFYSVTGKPTAFKAVQYAAKFWKNPMYITNIPTNISEKSFPYSHIDKKCKAEQFKGEIHSVIKQIDKELPPPSQDTSTTSHQFLKTTTLLSNYLEAYSLFEANTVPDGIDTAILSESLHLKKLNDNFTESTITQIMPLVCYPSITVTDMRIVQMETTINALSIDPIRACKSEAATPTTTTTTVEEQKNSISEQGTVEEPSPSSSDSSKLKKKSERDSTDNKENVSSKNKKKEGGIVEKIMIKIKKPSSKKDNGTTSTTNQENNKKSKKKKNGKIENSNNNKKVSFDLSGAPKRISVARPRNREKKLYEVKNPVRIQFQEEICGERASALDLEYLKSRKLNVKTARGKLNHDFGVFCEEAWFRKQMYFEKRDLPIPLPPIHEPAIDKNGKPNKKRRFDPYTQEKAAQYAYAHIPIPENHSAYPLLPTLHCEASLGFDKQQNGGNNPLSLDNYAALEEEYKNSLLKAHENCAKKEEFHWKEYLPHNLARDNADLLEIHKRIDLDVVQKIKHASEKL